MKRRQELGTKFVSRRRNWQLSVPKNNEGISLSITLKIRGEVAKNFVPEKLYCSHKYHVLQEIVFSDKVLKTCPTTFVNKIRIVNAETKKEVFRKGKTIIKGTETTGVRAEKKAEDPNLYQGKLRIQFAASSFHFNKAFFQMVIDYIQPTNNEVMIQAVSPPFQTFSRKPTVGKQTLQPQASKPTLKRKRKKVKKKPQKKRRYQEDDDYVEDEVEEEAVDEEEDEDAPPRKKRKRRLREKRTPDRDKSRRESGEGPQDEMSAFMEKLEETRHIRMNLRPEDQPIADDLTISAILRNTDEPRPLEEHPADNGVANQYDASGIMDGGYPPPKEEGLENENSRGDSDLQGSLDEGIEDDFFP